MSYNRLFWRLVAASFAGMGMGMYARATPNLHALSQIYEQWKKDKKSNA